MKCYKVLVYASVAILVLCLSGCNQSLPSEPSAPETPVAEAKVVADPEVVSGPRAMLEPDFFAFELKRGVDEPPVDITARLTNRGNAPLVLEPAQSGCGCSEVFLGVTELAPGEYTDIIVKLYLESFLMNQIAQIIIPTNDPDNRELPLVISVSWLEHVMQEPQHGIVKFGRVPMGETKTMTARLVQQFGEEKLIQQAVNVNGTLFDVEARPVSSNQKQAIEYELTLKPQQYAGLVNEVMEVITNSPRSPHRFHLVGLIEGPLRIDPQRVVFSGMQPSSVRERSIAVTPRGSARLMRLDTSSNTVMTSMEESGEGWTVYISYLAGDTPGQISEYVDLIDDQENILRIPVQGDVADEANAQTNGIPE